MTAHRGISLSNLADEDEAIDDGIDVAAHAAFHEELLRGRTLLGVDVHLYHHT